ncbi:hypothetical protein JAAARDRAFT_168055 [Jaapia argillacea MUCL 33604]|uniref:Uncharacterized protein n=1 Tax=Jaapia argillacea MUCL 33604 TaxID=933084 RepID=A0A067QDK3_9AGAM|nr:hypothetical protein JAAARDRAFT_168055 [Jaapia argillacea MUCL 33604]
MSESHTLLPWSPESLRSPDRPHQTSLQSPPGLSPDPWIPVPLNSDNDPHSDGSIAAFPTSIRPGPPSSSSSTPEKIRRPTSLTYGPRAPTAKRRNVATGPWTPATPATPDYPTPWLSYPSFSDSGHEYLSLLPVGEDDQKSAENPPPLPQKDRTPNSSASTPALTADSDPPPKQTRMGAFEEPDRKLVILHAILCLAAYGVLHLVARIAQNRSLFWARVLVGAGCGGVGLVLSFNLLLLTQKMIEAAAWATIIHHSEEGGTGGLRIKDLEVMSRSSTSAWVAISVIWNRIRYLGIKRNVRRSYDDRPWILVVLFFLITMIFGGMLPFIFARIVNITTRIEHQTTQYREVSVVGDLSDQDVAKASSQMLAFADFVRTWTLAPFASGTEQARPVTFQYGNDTVYFAEPLLSQLMPGGHGLGTFDLNGTQTGMTDSDLMAEQNQGAQQPGVLLRYPRWGIRIHCEKLSDPTLNLVPYSTDSLTYVFIPRDFVKTLFTSFSLVPPAIVNTPFNPSAFLSTNDSLPAGVAASNLYSGAKFYSNGVAHSFFSDGFANHGSDGNGWTYLEVVLVRLNSSYTPVGHYPVINNVTVLDALGRPTNVGYDAAVCLSLYEPWIVETFNSSIGLPMSTRIVEKGNTISTEHSKGQKMLGKIIQGVTRTLSSTNRWPAYAVAHDNSVNQMIKDNGRDIWYVPNPTLVSFTDGAGPNGYTELSASHFADARAHADAANVLPFLAGSGAVVAHSYTDLTLASASIVDYQLCIVLIFVLVIGCIGGLFVPKLPFGIPRRGFTLYSWIAAFQGQELVGDAAGALDRKMDLEEIRRQVGDRKLKYNV